MAGRARLKLRAGARLLALAAIVLLLHLMAMQWVAQQLQPLGVLPKMATPMFTRLLSPQAPAAPAPPPPQAIAVRPRRPAITSVREQATPAARAASQPAPAPVPAPAPDQPAPDAAVAAAEDASAQAPPQEKEGAGAAGNDPGAAPAPATDTAAAPAAPASASSPGLGSWPADTRLSYRLGGQFRSGELHGSAQVQWQRQGDRYESRVDISLTLLTSLVLTSQGEVTVQGLLPRAYEELRRSGPRGVRMGDATVTLGDGRNVPRPEGVQDAASQFVELSHRFAAGKDALEVGRSVSFWMARPGGVDLWTYDIVDREILQTPRLGAVEAFHLKPRSIANPRGNITAEMWFAPSLQYLPVRIRVSMGEATWVDLIVDKIEQR